VDGEAYNKAGGSIDNAYGIEYTYNLANQLKTERILNLQVPGPTGITTRNTYMTELEEWCTSTQLMVRTDGY